MTATNPTVCQGCGLPSDKPLRRCSSCRSAWYCSIACQRRDWKRQHGRICRAYQELGSLLCRATLEQAQRDYHLARDHAERLGDESGQPVETDSESNLEQRSAESTTTKTPSTVVDEQSVTADVDTPVVVDNPPRPFSVSSDVSNTEIDDDASDWRFSVRDMPNVSCFRVQLEVVSATTTILQPDDFKVSLQAMSSPPDEPITRVVFTPVSCATATPLILDFGARLLPASPRITVDDEKSVSIRLEYEPGSSSSSVLDSANGGSSLITQKQANQLACGKCRRSLMKQSSSDDDPNRWKDATTASDPVIRRVARLPTSGRWDEMADYLTCYSGPSLDFGPTSTAAVAGCLWYDETVVVVHANDIDPTAVNLVAKKKDSVASLSPSDQAVDVAENSIGVDKSDERGASSQRSNGDTLERDDQTWRPVFGEDEDTTANATVTCRQCSATLGWAPLHQQPDTYRLLQHCLCGANSPFTTTSRFVVHEMIRYAESRAMFAFCVVQKDAGDDSPCLLLRLLSWDTQAATSVIPGTRRLQWQSVAQVVYQHEASLATVLQERQKNQMESSLQWMMSNSNWTGCSLPTSNSQGAASEGPSTSSLVRIYLSKDEFAQVMDDLKESGRWYPWPVVQATILASTGRWVDQSSNNRLGLAAIQISN